jgi:TonB-dependent receptor
MSIKQPKNTQPLFQKKILAVVCSLSFSGMALAADADVSSDENSDSQIEEIIITGRQQAIVNANERKRLAQSAIDSIVADDAGKLPDASITEVLQRVSGVSIVRFASLGDPDHFSAQGTGVQVRGLSGVAGRLNGREVFSSSSGRGLSWSDVTPEMMAAVDVYKSSTADLIEGGTGGQIDLRTKMPFDYQDGFKAQMTLSGSYGDLSEGGPTPNGSILLTDRWDTQLGEFGALIDLSLSKFKSHSDFIRMEPFYKTRLSDGTDKYVPGGYDYGSDDYERDRKGAYLALQWVPSDTLSVAQTVFYSKYNDRNLSSGQFVVSKELAVDPAASEFDHNGILRKSDKLFLRNTGTFESRENETLYAGGNTGFSKNESETQDVSTSFEWNPSEKWGVKGAFQTVKSTGASYGYDIFPNVPFSGSYALDLTGDLPQITMPASTEAMLSDRSKYTWNNTMDHTGDTEGSMHAVNIDANYIISEEGFFRSTQFGARYADRTENDNNAVYNWSALGVGWNGFPQKTLSEADSRPGDVEWHEFKNFFRGDAKLPGATWKPSFDMALKYDVLGDHEQYGNPGQGKAIIGLFDPSSQENKNEAIYGLIRFADDTNLGVPVSGNLGMRYVRIESTSNGFYKQNPSTFLKDGVLTVIPETGEARSGGATFSKVLPSINLKFDPSENLSLRLGYNITMDQAGFYQLKASGTTNVRTISSGDGGPGQFDGFISDAGNPELKPVISHNSDASIEWYPSQVTSFHASLFHKSIDNWFTYGNATVPVPITYTAPESKTVMEQASKTDIYNSDKAAIVKGFEVGGRAFFEKLPSPWDGLGVEVNYTYIDSKNPGDLYHDINGISHTDAPVQGLSKNNANLVLMYEKEQWSLRMAYNWRSRYLMGTHGNGTDGDYNYFSAPGQSTFVDISLANFSDDYGQWDMGGTYRVTDNASVSLQISNVTNEITKTLQYGYPGGTYLPRSWFIADRRAELVLRYDF